MKATRETLCQKYAPAGRLRFTSPPAEWLAVFPDRAALETFRRETGNLSFPETYGQSPWDDAFSLAFELTEGISPTSAAFYKRRMAEPRNRAEVEGKLALIRLYGGTVPPSLSPCSLVSILAAGMRGDPRLHDRARDHVALSGHKLSNSSGALAVAVRTAPYI